MAATTGTGAAPALLVTTAGTGAARAMFRPTAGIVAPAATTGEEGAAAVTPVCSEYQGIRVGNR